MVGRWLSFCDALFSGAMLSFRECTHQQMLSANPHHRHVQNSINSASLETTRGFEVRNKQISVPRAIGFNANFGGKELKDRPCDGCDRRNPRMRDLGVTSILGRNFTSQGFGRHDFFLFWDGLLFSGFMLVFGEGTAPKTNTTMESRPFEDIFPVENCWSSNVMLVFREGIFKDPPKKRIISMLENQHL